MQLCDFMDVHGLGFDINVFEKFGGAEFTAMCHAVSGCVVVFKQFDF